MKTIKCVVLLVLLPFFASAQGDGRADSAKVIAYDGFSGLAKGWSGVWNHTGAKGRTLLFDNIDAIGVCDRGLSYVHPSGIFIDGGGASLQINNWEKPQAFKIARGLLEPVDGWDQLYLSMLVQFNEQVKGSDDYVSIGGSRMQFSSGLALGNYFGNSSLATAYSCDGINKVLLGENIGLEANKTYMLVLKFKLNSQGIVERIKCFINPISMSTENAEWTTVLDDISSEFNGVEIMSSFHGIAYFDELTLGATWASVVVTQSFDAAVESDGVTSFIAPVGYWSDSAMWSSGVPALGADTVYVNGQCIVDDNIDVEHLLLLPGAKLLLSDSAQISASTSILLKSNLRERAECYSEALALDYLCRQEIHFRGGQWNYITIPEVTKAGDLFPNLSLATSWSDPQADYYVAEFSEQQRAANSNGVIDIFENNYPLYPGQGYMVWTNVDQIGVFDIHTRQDSVDVRTTNTLVGVDDSGWNMIGNPFSHAMNYAELLDSSSLNCDYFAENICVWDRNSFKVWAHNVGDAEAEMVKPLEAFLVKRLSSSSEAISFRLKDNLIDLNADNDIPDEDDCVNNSMAIGLSLMEGTKADFTYVNLKQDVSVGFEEGVDAVKVFADPTQYSDNNYIYSIDESHLMAVNSVSLGSDYVEVPLVVDLAQDLDSVILSFNVDGDSSYLYKLIDEETMTIRPITHGDVVAISTYNQRFIHGRLSVFITRAPQKDTGLGEFACVKSDLAKVLTELSGVRVQSLVDESLSLMLWRVDGEMITNTLLEARSLGRYDLKKGAYVLRLSTGEEVYAQKLVIP